MLNTVDNNMPDQFFAICEEDGFIYKYDKTNTVDSETGKFLKYTSTGTDIINLASLIMSNYADFNTIIYDTNRELNDLTDVEVSAPTDGQVLKYDATNNTWTNSDDAGNGQGSTNVLTQTLTAGSTTVTFTNIPTTGDYLVDFYTSTGINFKAINTATAGQITLTFDEQSSNVVVYCEIKEIQV
jgi:hypothetical protein